MNMYYSYPTTMYESILAHRYVFLVFLHFNDFTMIKILSKKCKKKKIFYQNCVYSGENIFIHCNQITVVHIHVNIFLDNSPSMSG